MMMMPYPPATTDEVTLLTSNLQYIYGLSLNQQRQQVVMDLWWDVSIGCFIAEKTLLVITLSRGTRWRDDIQDEKAIMRDWRYDIILADVLDDIWEDDPSVIPTFTVAAMTFHNILLDIWPVCKTLLLDMCMGTMSIDVGWWWLWTSMRI